MVSLESRIVYQPPRPLFLQENNPGLESEEVWFESEDGVRLHGWFFPHSEERFALLYCHGNGEDAERNVQLMSFLRDRLQMPVFVFDYRGYGHSSGTPTEEGVVKDGIAAQLWLAEKQKISPSHIVLFGRSLGGGVAVACAEKLGTRAVVVRNTFADMTSVAASRYFWLPVRLLMRNRYPSQVRIKNYVGPFFQIHGTKDKVIPIDLATPLFEAAPGKPKRFYKIEGGRHNDPLPDDCYEALIKFLDELPPAG